MTQEIKAVFILLLLMFIALVVVTITDSTMHDDK